MLQRLVTLTLLLTSSLTAGLRAQLTPPPYPAGNPPTAAKVLLGKVLFWDEQLSGDDSMACGTCHAPEAGGSDPRAIGWHPGPDGVLGSADDVRGSIGTVRQAANGDFVPARLFGMRPQATRRMAPTVHAAGHHQTLNWDGSAGPAFVDPETGAVALATGAALETQALQPILDPREMGFEGRTWHDVTTKLAARRPLALARDLPGDVAATLQRCPDYPSLFALAFGDRHISARRIAFALASYERTLTPDQTPWDRFQAGDGTALTQLQKAGWSLFQQGHCMTCHPAPLFADGSFHNLGLRPASEDPGRAAVVATPNTLGAFRTPTLRNAGLRPRLFHNGRAERLGHPINFYAQDSTLNTHWRGSGGFPSQVSPSLPALSQLGFSQYETALMFEFVRTALVDPRAAQGLPPFDHPTLRSTAEPPPRRFGATTPGSNEPFLVDWIPSYPGNADFRLGLVGGAPGALAALGIGLQSYEPPVLALGVHLNLAVHSWLPFVLGGTDGQPGRATWHVPLVGLPNLQNTPLYYQMVVADPAAPAGLAGSQGTEFFIR